MCLSNVRGGLGKAVVMVGLPFPLCCVLVGSGWWVGACLGGVGVASSTLKRPHGGLSLAQVSLQRNPSFNGSIH